MAKTGVNSAYDLEPAQAALLAIKQWNAKGGVLGRHLEPLWIDSKSNPAQGGTNAIDLINKKSVAMMVACDFDLGAPGAIKANAAHIPAFSCASDPKFGDTKTVGPYAFGLNGPTNRWGAIMAEWAYAKGWRKAYILQDVSYAFAKSLGRYFTERFQQLGGNIVGVDTWNATTDTEFGPLITRYRAASARSDFIWLPSWVPPAASLIRQFRGAAVKVPFLCADSCEGHLLTDTAGPVSDIYFVTIACVGNCHSNVANPKIDQFLKDYAAEYGAAPDTAYALMGYDFVDLVVQAINDAKSTDGPALLDALNKFKDVEALSGTYSFTPTVHYPEKKAGAIIQVQNGTFSLLMNYTPEVVPPG
jgi:branched-chain amino acid transport system substrate-binding protein